MDKKEEFYYKRIPYFIEAGLELLKHDGFITQEMIDYYLKERYKVPDNHDDNNENNTKGE